MYFFAALREYLYVILIVCGIVLVFLIVRYNRAIRNFWDGLWQFTSGSWDKFALGITHVEIDIKGKGKVGGTEFQFEQPIRQKVELPNSTFFEVASKKLTEYVLREPKPPKKKHKRRRTQ